MAAISRHPCFLVRMGGLRIFSRQIKPRNLRKDLFSFMFHFNFTWYAYWINISVQGLNYSCRFFFLKLIIPFLSPIVFFFLFFVTMLIKSSQWSFSQGDLKKIIRIKNRKNGGRNLIMGFRYSLDCDSRGKLIHKCRTMWICIKNFLHWSIIL